MVDVAEKTIELRNFHNAKVPLEVVAEAHFCTSETVDATDVGKGTSGTGGYNSWTIFRKVRLDFSSITHHVAMTATPSKDSYHHQTDTAHGQTDVSSGHFQASSLPNHLACGVHWRSRAGELLPVRRWRRRPVDALAHTILHRHKISIMISNNQNFNKKTTRSKIQKVKVSNKRQTNYFGNHEKSTS